MAVPFATKMMKNVVVVVTVVVLVTPVVQNVKTFFG